MKTKRIKLYKFDELSNEAKQTVISNYRSKEYNQQLYYDEVTASVKELIELFNLKTGNRYSDLRTGHIDDNILELKGKRLYAYIMNHYYYGLHKGKYIKMIDRNLDWTQFRVSVGFSHEGKVYSQVYSKNFFVNDCTLTGVCYDNEILEPIYQYLKKPSLSTTFKDLIDEIERAIKEAYDNVEEWINSDQFIIDDIQANFSDTDYTVNGIEFNF